MLFHHTRTAEEAYYVGEMARGADSAVATGVCLTQRLIIAHSGLYGV